MLANPWTHTAAAAIVVLATLVATPVAHAQQDPSAPSELTGQDPPENKVLVTVGGVDIRQGDLDAMLSQVEPYKRSAFEDRALAKLTKDQLHRQFVTSNELPVDEQQFQKFVEYMKQRYEQQIMNARVQMALNKFVSDQVADEKVAQYMKANPHFFDGTTVEVSRILIKCPIFASTTDQLAARDKLARIREDIESRRITFSAAAKQFSDCPSKANDGKLGKLEFGGASTEMVMKIAAFMTGEGEVTPILRTDDGWEILRVNKVERGDGKAKAWKDPRSGKDVPAETLAKQAIVALVEKRILSTVTDECPVVNHRDDQAAADAATKD